MIGDFIRRGQRGRAASIEGLTSHRTPKTFANETLLPAELYPTVPCKLGRRKNSSSKPQVRHHWLGELVGNAKIGRKKRSCTAHGVTRTMRNICRADIG
jgi:hypothetical protein